MARPERHKEKGVLILTGGWVPEQSGACDRSRPLRGESTPFVTLPGLKSAALQLWPSQNYPACPTPSDTGLQ